MKKLYDKLVASGQYTKSFEDFKEQFGDAEKSKKLFDAVSETGDYTKTFEDFNTQFGFEAKKEDSVDAGQAAESDQAVEMATVSNSGNSLSDSEVINKDFEVQGEKSTKEGFENVIENPLVGQTDYIDVNKYKKAFGSDIGSYEQSLVSGKDLDNVINYIDELSKEKIVPREQTSTEAFFEPIAEVSLKALAVGLNNVPAGLEKSWEATKTMGIDVASNIGTDSRLGDLLSGGGLQGSVSLMDPATQELVTKEDRTRYDELKSQGAKAFYAESGKEVGFAAEEYIIDQFKKIKKIDSEVMEVGSIVQGYKKGSAVEMIGGVLNVLGGLAQTAIPAALTGGASIIPQVAAPMYIDYNVEKANTLYPDSENAISELVENGETNIAIPAALGTLAAGFEYIGFKGITKQIAGKTGAIAPLVAMTLTQSQEGLTEVAQLGTETFSKGIARGLKPNEALMNAALAMGSEQGLESFLGGFLGSGIVTVGPTISTMLRSDQEGYDMVHNTIKEIGDLQQAKAKTKSKELKKIYDDQIDTSTSALKDYLESNERISKKLTKDQRKELISLSENRQENNKSIASLSKSYEDGEIDSKQFQYGKAAIMNSNRAISNKISKVKKDADAIELKDNFNKDIENVGKSLNSIGQKVDETIIFEDNKNNSASNQMRDFLIQSGQSKEYAEENKDSYGAFILKEGKEFLVVNKTAALSDKVVTTGQHEFLHKLLKASLNTNPEVVTKAGRMLLKEVAESNKENSEIMTRIKSYSDDANITTDKFFEEILPLFSEALTRKSIKLKESSASKIGDFFRQVFQNFGYKKINFNKAEGVVNFIKDYNKAYSKGEFKGSLKNLAGEGNLSDSVNFSKPLQELETELEELIEDEFSFEDESDFNAQKSNLELKIRMAKKKGDKAPVKEPTAKEKIDKSADEVFEEKLKAKESTVISNKSLKIAAKNTDISNEMLALGANRLSDIKDPATRKRIADKLIENNMGAVGELAKRSAFVGKSLDISDDSRVNLEDFIAGYNEQLVSIANSYKVKSGDKIVPFGAYMKPILRLRYGQILNEAIKGKLKNTSSMSDDRTLQVAESVSNESSSSNSNVSDVEQIDVRKTPVVASKLKEIEDVIDLKDVDINKLTYATAGDMFIDKIAKVLLGISGDKASGKATVTSKKAGDIDNGAVTAMQNLFKSTSDVKRFISVMPEYNITTNETIINKQGETIDVSKGVKGISLKINAKTIASFYEPFVDPKSSSSDASVKKQSLTSPKGRSKGLTSQTATFRLKPQFRGKISNDAINEFKEIIGLTPAGEARIPISGDARSKFGTVLQGVTKMYLNNVTNVVVRSKIEDNKQALADIGAGKSSLMFSKSWFDGVNKDFGTKNPYNLDTRLTDLQWKKQSRIFLKDYEWFVNNYALGAFRPHHFISSKTTINNKKAEPYGEEATKAYERRKALRSEITKINDKNKISNTGFNSPPGIFGTTVEDITKNFKSGKISKANDKYGKVFDKTWTSIADMVRKKPSMIPFASLLLESANSDTSHFHRLGATLVGYSTNPKAYSDGNTVYEYEHAVQSHIVLKKLFLAAVDKNVNFNQVLQETKKNYKLIALSAKDNAKLREAGYALKMPKDWKNWWDRYFNDKVASIDGGININELEVIENIDGNDVLTPMKNFLGIDNDGSRVSFSKSLSRDFNKIIENKTGIASQKTFSKVKAALVGSKKRKFNLFIHPSAEDFMGLLYSTLGKGKVGDAQMEFYKENLTDPYARAVENITRDRNNLGRDFKELKKKLKIVPKDLKKLAPGGLFTKEQAVRVYIWDSTGKTPPGLSAADLIELTNMVKDDADLKAFADQIMRLNKGSAYVTPKEGWLSGTITSDLLEALNTTRRKEELALWKQNVDIIFSEPNMNKLEAAFGKPYRIAMENILKRMETGRNRTFGGDTLTGRFTDWLNGSVAAIMFFNTRSAVLQTISAVNFINFGDNNILAASKAFANQPLFWKDFIKLFNSDFLTERRDGLKINVNEADIADVAKENGIRGVIGKLLKLGFAPTQIADSFAIASGGAAFYRNRYNALVKGGMNEIAADKQALRDFREIAEESQQSSRPDKISQQQAGPLGRIVLAFANTPAQYARLMKKAASDLKNGRGDAKTNLSKILYYGVAQNLFFNAVQQALFAISFGDDEDEEVLDNKKINIINGMVDSVARGTGVGGAIFTVVKNAAIKVYRETQKDNPSYKDIDIEILKISPPIASKINKIRSAGRTLSWDKDEIMEKGLSLDNPANLAVGNYVSAATNIPLDRLIKKINNLKAASDSELETYKRLALVAGWTSWELGIKEEKKDKKKKKTLRTRIKRVINNSSFKKSSFKKNKGF